MEWLLLAASVVLLVVLIQTEMKQKQVVPAPPIPVTKTDDVDSEVLPVGFIGNPSTWKIFVINRDVDVERLRNFEQTWKDSDFKKFGVLSYERFPAIVPPENIENLKPLISNEAFEELKRTENRGMRLHDESLTRGAVGCYLSHYTIWQQSIANGYKHVLIFEDDAVIHPDFCSIMMLQQVAKNWSILKAGYYCIDCNETPYNYVELKKDWCLHAYFLNTSNINKYLNYMMPMAKQIDWQLHSVGAPMYGTLPVLSYQENSKFETTVQTQ